MSEIIGVRAHRLGNKISGKRAGTSKTRTHIYLEVGIEPAFDLIEDGILSLSASFPVVTGLSLSNYYEGVEPI